MGCSKEQKIDVRWDYGVLSNNGVVFEVDSYRGYEASKTIDDEVWINYYPCTGPNDCTHNLLGISADVMSDYTDGSKYYTAYFDTNLALYVPWGETWNEGLISVPENSGYSVGTMLELMYPNLKAMPLNSGLECITINNSVQLLTVGRSFEARKDCVVIPGFVKIGTNDGSVTMSESVVIGEATVGKMNSTKYDYYQYGDVLIQAAAGIDISQYVQFIVEG